MWLLRKRLRILGSVSPNRSRTSSCVYFRGGVAVPTDRMRGPVGGRQNATFRGDTMRWMSIMVRVGLSRAPGGEPVELPRMVRPEIALDAPRQVTQAVAQAALQEDIDTQIERTTHRLVPAERVPQVSGRFLGDFVDRFQDVLSDARDDAAVRRAEGNLREEAPDLGLGVAQQRRVERHRDREKARVHAALRLGDGKELLEITAQSGRDDDPRRTDVGDLDRLTVLLDERLDLACGEADDDPHAVSAARRRLVRGGADAVAQLQAVR